MAVLPKLPEGVTLAKTEDFCCVLTAGLLGAKVDIAHFDAGGPRVITDARLEEAERRIIELEAVVEEMRSFLAL